LTKDLGFEKQRLYVTVFEGDRKNDLPADTESIEVWKDLGIPENHIFKYGPEKNWWSRAGVPDNMPDGEPGGPDSEVFFEFSNVNHNPQYGKKCHPNCDCGRFMEIGNSVFMQYKKTEKGFEELPKKNVDFGGGLERILAALNNDPDVFNISIFKTLNNSIKSKIIGKVNEVRYKRVRIFLDHARAIMFLIQSGVYPGKNDRESVVRRLIRRSDDQLNILFQGDRLKCDSVWNEAYSHFKSTYDPVYKIEDSTLNIIKEELIKYQKVFKYIKEEEDKFISLIKNFPNISTASGVAGPIAFDYQSSKGVPFETSKFLAEKLKMNIKIWEEKYRERMLEHKQISKKGVTKKFKGGLADHSTQTIIYHTATHLLHQALFDVLGNDTRQEGSNITVERLRFDFYSPIKPTYEQIKQAELIINKKIKESIPVEFKIIPREEAYKIGARSFFREKYPDMVKVYFVGDYSKEFCGGPHVNNTSEIGQIRIFKFEKIGSNLYRIYAK